MMISDTEAYMTLRSLKYKPTWEFRVENPRADLIVLQIRINGVAPDSNMVIVSIGKELNFRPSGYQNAEHLLAGVLRFIEDIEIGLCRAWFKEANK
jgi:hypothetical protein